MFVVTADQVASRRGADRVDGVLARLGARYTDTLELPPERTAGDELQALTPDATGALGMVLDLAREGGWSIGLGIGGVRTPLGATTRASSGAAFIAARTAVERARRGPEPRLGLVVAGDSLRSADLEALLALTLVLRDRRTAAGWAVADLMAEGLRQSTVAERLGITAQAVSQRALAAGLRVEQQAIPALVRLLDEADRTASADTAKIDT